MISGLYSSQNNLVWMYYKRIRVDKSLSEPIFWVTQALDQGEPFTHVPIGKILFDGNGFKQNNIENYK